MSSSAKSDIFAKLEKAASPLSSNEILRESWALGEPPHPTLPADNTIEAFLINVLKNRGTLDCVSNRSEAVKAISQFLYKNYHTQRLVVSNDSRLAAMPWRDGGLLPRFGQVEPGEPVALGFAKLAIAELGAIVTFTGKANPAENNLLPEHHLVTLNRRGIEFSRKPPPQALPGESILLRDHPAQLISRADWSTGPMGHEVGT
jgi:L-lactate dehydrogenase complex protein LldG